MRVRARGARDADAWTAWMAAASILAGAGVLLPASAGGQAVPRTASWYAAGESATALLRGVEARGGNPATLAFTGAPGPAFGLFTGSLGGGLHPVGLRTLASHQGDELSRDLREEWLVQMESTGGWKGAGTASIAPLAVRAGSFLFEVGTTARVRGLVNPDAAELLLFGNAGREGEERSYSLAGSGFDGAAFTTFGIAAGFPLPLGPSGSVAVGGRANYTIGHALMLATDLGSGFQGRPPSMNVEFPVVDSFGSGGRSVGGGFGLDLGGMWEHGSWVWSLAATNVLQTFDWHRNELQYRPGSAYAGPSGSGSDLEARPLEEAPAQVRESVDRLGFARGIGLAAAYRLQDDLTLAAEARRRFGGELSPGPALHVGAAIEHRPRAWTTFRSGAAIITDGYQLGFGVDLEGRRFLVGTGVRVRADGYGRRALGSLSLSVVPGE